MLFTKKYMPKKIKDVLGQPVEKVISALKQNKPVLIYGPPGTGKTSTAYAIANEWDLDLIEINASDERSKKELEKLIPAVKQMTVFGKKRLILIDEIDGLSSEDRGGVSGIKTLIQESKFPVILTANDPWDAKFKDLRKMCVLIEYKPLTTRVIVAKLKQIAIVEKIDVDENTLKEIAQKSKGDLRAALNDLQSIAFATDKSTDVLSRDLETQIFEALGRVFKGENFFGLLMAFENLDLDPEEVMYWIEHNLFREYEKLDEIKKALENISNANYLIQFIKKSQYWRLIVYVNFFLSVGVGLAKEQKYHKFTSYKQPDVFLLKWQANNRNAIKNAIIEKLSERLHVSTLQIRKLFDAYVNIFKNNPTLAEEFLSNEELNYINEFLKKKEKELKNKING